MSTPLVSIIIPSFNEGDWLTKTVKGCLERTNYPDFEIVVVADGCTDDSVAQLGACNFPNLKIIELPSSQGAIVARNKGAAEAKGEVLVFIDSHQEPITPNWLKVLIDLLDKPRCGAATINISSLGEADRLGYLYTLKNWTLEPTWEKPKNPDGERLAPAIPGGCFAIKKSLFTATGGFNVNLKIWGREDFEYSLRLWRLGYDLWFSPSAVMGHAFNHKRAFEISWDQVDYNTLWIARTLMNTEALNKVIEAVTQERPQVISKVKKSLGQSNIEIFSAQLSESFTRPFEDYQQQFITL